MGKAKKQAAAKNEPLKLDMSFEEAIRRSITTKIPKKKVPKKKKKVNSVHLGMRILFDLDAKFPGGRDNLTPEQNAALQAIWNYVYHRIAYLADEMEQEESKDDQPRAVLIYLLETPCKIQPRGYSDRLTEKIIGSFNDQDAALLWQSVVQAFQAAGN